MNKLICTSQCIKPLLPHHLQFGWMLRYCLVYKSPMNRHANKQFPRKASYKTRDGEAEA